jgi:mRNA interferase MazF
MEIRKGQIYYADLTSAEGSEQGGIRPVLIVQNDKGNQYAPTTIVAPLTCSRTKHKLPTHIKTTATGRESTILMEQVRVIDKTRLREYVASLECRTLEEVNKALRISLGL